MMRSMSLQREGDFSRNPGDNTKEKQISTPTSGRGVRNWRMGKWLSTDRWSPRSNYNSSISSSKDEVYISPPLQEKQMLQVKKQTLGMSLLFRRLKELLPPFCQALAECKFVHCCTILGPTMVTNRPSTHTSPLFKRGASPSSCSPRSSPRRSPIRAWFATAERRGSNESQEDENAAAIVDSNMEVFFLLAGVEALYMSMTHAITPNFAQLLLACYGQVVKDLQLLRLALCDAFLLSPPTSESAGSVSFIATPLSELILCCQARIQCIQLQSAMWHQSSTAPNFAEMAALFETVLSGLRGTRSGDQPKATVSMIEPFSTVVTLEIEIWIGICQTAFSVQHCRFAKSILGAQATKGKMLVLTKTRASKKTTCMELWLRDSLQGVVGVFPIVFDKASSFAKPLYGFQEGMDVLHGSSFDSMGSFQTNSVSASFESEVNDALERFKAMGAISVAVVLDAMRSGTARPDTGFNPFDTSKIVDSSDPEVAIRQQYPAIYMRTMSTVPSFVATPDTPPGSPGTGSSASIRSPSNPRIQGRQNSFRERLEKVFEGENSNSNLVSSPQLSSSPKLRASRSKDGKVASRKKHDKSIDALEYGLEDGSGSKTVSWPHSEWSSLATLLNDSGDDGDGDSSTAVYNNPAHDGFETKSSHQGPRVSYNHQTTYCIESLSESMWLVAVMKNMDLPASVWYWHTPTTESVEDDLRELVANLASMVRVSDRFEAGPTQILREKFLDRSSDEIGAGLAKEIKERGYDAGEISHEGLFRLIKNQLRALSQFNTTSSVRDRTALSTRSRLLRRGQKKGNFQSIGYTESAAALFLGRELMHTVVFE